MRRVGSPLIELVYGAAMILMVIVGGFFLLVYFDRVSLEARPPYSELGLGVLSLLVALYFLSRLAQRARSRARIMTMGSGGPIWVSRKAVRDFVLQVVEEELGVREVRVSLRPMRQGIGIEVRTAMPLEANIAELGERIQERVRSRVEERIGVTVKKIEVFTQSIRAWGAEPAPPSTTGSEARREPERGRGRGRGREEGEAHE